MKEKKPHPCRWSVWVRCCIYMFNNAYGRGQITKCMTKDIIGNALLGDVQSPKETLGNSVRLY